MAQHFLTGTELSPTGLQALLQRAAELKSAPLSSNALTGQSVGLLFQRPSTRTRISFEAGIHELGGHPMVLRSEDLQLSRGESLRDTALIFSRHLGAIGVRTGPDEMLAELSHYASIPVFNMLTALHHPCQALADLFTVKEVCGSLEGVRLAYLGDGTNVARSLVNLGTLAGMDVAIASPSEYSLPADLSPPAREPLARSRSTSIQPRPSAGHRSSIRTCG